MRKDARILRSKTIYRGRVVELKLEHVVEPGGVETTRELVCHAGSVVVVPHLSRDRLILVRQYRHAAKKRLWEFVAGGLEPGETPRQAARRELVEEAGYRPKKLRPVIDFYPSPGILTERMHLVEAWDLIPAEGRPDDDERIEVGTFTIRELMEMVGSNKIEDGKTLIGAMFLFGREHST